MNTQLNETTNQNLLKSLKLLSQWIRKHCNKTLGTNAINSPLSHLSLFGKSNLFAHHSSHVWISSALKGSWSNFLECIFIYLFLCFYTSKKNVSINQSWLVCGSVVCQYVHQSFCQYIRSLLVCHSNRDNTMGEKLIYIPNDDR